MELTTWQRETLILRLRMRQSLHTLSIAFYTWCVRVILALARKRGLL